MRAWINRTRYKRARANNILMKQYIAFGQGWEKELGDFYKKFYQDVLDKHGFDLYEKQEGPGMGALIMFVGHGIIVRIINDRSQFFVSIGNEIGLRHWWDIEFIMAYFKIIDDKISLTDTTSRKKILCDSFNWANYAENVKYFSTHFDRIKQLFVPDNFEVSKVILNKVADELSKYRQEKWDNKNKKPL